MMLPYIIHRHQSIGEKIINTTTALAFITKIQFQEISYWHTNLITCYISKFLHYTYPLGSTSRIKSADSLPLPKHQMGYK